MIPLNLDVRSNKSLQTTAIEGSMGLICEPVQAHFGSSDASNAYALRTCPANTLRK